MVYILILCAVNFYHLYFIFYLKIVDSTQYFVYIEKQVIFIFILKLTKITKKINTLSLKVQQKAIQ